MIQLGLNVPNFGPTATPENLHSWVRFAEDNGFAVAMLSDHVAPTPDVTATYPAPFYDPFITLSWVAAATQRVLLGTTVTILPYRHPLHTARMAAVIDRFTGGRFVLGVGVGWSAQEYTALGLAFHERGAMTDEYLAAIVDAWTHDRTSFDGRYLQYRDVSTGPSPVQSPHPPIWVGGASRAAIRRAARFADAWHPVNPDLDWLRTTGLPTLRAAADDLQRPPPALCPRIRAHLTTRDLPATDRPLGAGSLAQILDDIAALTDLGATHIVLDTNPDDPADRQPAARDHDTLYTIATHVGARHDNDHFTTTTRTQS